MMKKQKAFSLIEAVMSLTLLGVIILMIAPIVAGRSVHSTEIQCADGGQEVCYESECSLDIETGMDRLWITVIKKGGNGTKYSKNKIGYNKSNSVGTAAGETYKTFYYNNGRGIKLKNGEYDKVNVNVNDSKITFSKNDTDKLLTSNITNSTMTNSFAEQLNNKYPLRAGMPAFGDFLGPLFGVGAYGEYRLTAGKKYYDVPVNSDVVIFEWSGTCVSTRGGE